MKVRVLVVVFLLCSAIFSYAENTKIAQTGAAYLRTGFGSRPAALGEAYTGVSGDINSLFWNPAGISYLNEVQFAFGHNEFIQGLRYENIAVAFPFYDGGIGFAFTYMSFGDLERRDDTGVFNGNFKPYAFVGQLTYAKNIFKNFSLGINAKIPYERIDTDSKFGLAFDGGILLKLAIEGLSYGVSVNNIGPSFAGSKLPLIAKTGFGYTQGQFNFVLDLSVPRDIQPNLNFGCEYKLMQIFSLRGGYKYKFSGNDLGTISGITGGIGFELNKFNLDYSFKTYQDLGNSHIVSLIVKM
ncbi:MAG: PorV/PorQ family protein [Candidatus Firestonebacteria bacterium]